MPNRKNLNVVTISLNPMLDLTEPDALVVPEQVNANQQFILQPSGKGSHVAVVLAQLGANVTATGFLGIENEDTFCQLFEDMAITDKFIRVQGATRININVGESAESSNHNNHSGVSVSDAALSAFERQLFELAMYNDVFIISGSLPIGISPKVCAAWIQRLQQFNKQVFFDSCFNAFGAGLMATPWLVKPNEKLLTRWLGRDVNSTDKLLKAGEKIAAIGVENVVISLAERGVMWLQNGSWMRAIPPKVDTLSTAGAGDTLVAGLCWGLMNGWDQKQTIIFATALSTASVTLPRTLVPEMALVESHKAALRIM